MNPAYQTLLMVEGGPDQGNTIPLSGPVTTIGRQPGNDVLLQEPAVSRRHAEIVETDAGYLLRDLYSSNGTFVNDKRIPEQEYRLSDGDRIRLGPSEVSFVFRSSTGATQQITLVQEAAQGVEFASAEAQPADAAAAAEEAALPAEGEEIYEGTVRLNVQAEGSMALVMGFTQRLRERPAFRLLRLNNNPRGGVDIWLGLREPLPLRQTLGELESVADCSPVSGSDLGPETDETVLSVLLSAAPSPD